MKDTNATTFKPGDIVIWTEGGTWNRHDTWGAVLRVTPKGTVFACRDSKSPQKEFRGGNGLRKPSAEELAHKLWMQRRPRGEYATMYCGLDGRETPQHVDVESRKLDSPERIRQAAAELLTIAAWWDDRPEGP